MDHEPSTVIGAPPRGDRELLLALALGLVFAFAARFAGFSLLADDAFISFRCAENLARTGELVYNAGERVEAFSNLSFTLALAAGVSLGGPAPVVAVALGFLAGAGVVLVVAGAAHRCHDCSPSLAMALGLTVALSPCFAFWAGAGLETALFAALLLAATLTASSAHPANPRSAATLGGLVGLLALTRPEGHLVVPLVGPWLWARGFRPRAIVTGALFAATLPLVALAWRWSYYGALVPNPVLAKVALTPAALARGLAYVGVAARDDAWYALLPTLALTNLGSVRSRLLLGGVLGGGMVAIAAGGDGLYRARLLAPYFPLLVLATADAATRWWRRGGGWRVAALCGPLAATLVPMASPRFFRDHTLAEVREWEARWSAVGDALARQHVPTALLATNVAGRVPYASRLRTVDLLGLADRTIALTPVTDVGRGYAGHERAAPRYLLERSPDVIYLSVVDGLPLPALSEPRVVARFLANGALRRYAPLFASPEFVRRYAPATLELADGTHAALFVRRDGALARLAAQR